MMTSFINSRRCFESCAVLQTQEEVEAFAVSVIQWFYHIVPSSCVEGRPTFNALPYIPIERVVVEDGTEEDTDAWDIFCHAGANGAFLFGLCLWIWKRDGGEQFDSSRTDYDAFLANIIWMLRECIRVGKDYF